MSAIQPAAPAEGSFLKLTDDPCLVRCYSQSALGRYTHEESPLALAAASAQTSRKNMTASEESPMGGDQEIVFFDDDFGIIISDLTYAEDFDYEFVYEELSFLQFRLEGRSQERLSDRRSANLVHRPGFKISTAPRDCVDTIKMMSDAPWRTITPFLSAETMARLMGPDSVDFTKASAAFRAWQLREEKVLHPLSIEIAEALKAIMRCPLKGRLRETYLEAKTVELVCLAISACSDESHFEPLAPLSAPERRRIEEARDILDRNFVSPPTLAALGRMVGLNRRKLATGFRQCFQISIMQYCLARRMALAHSLLQEGSAIAFVADATGYADQASFSRAFRRHFGASPGALKSS